MNKNIILLFIIFLLSAAVMYGFWSAESETLKPISERGIFNSSDIVPTESPFQEMTIPYLRQQKFSSSLGELEFVSENTSYTNYLTNYESDGNTINGLLTVPMGEVPSEGWPAVVFIHGYIPPAQYQTLERYVDYVDYLARNGLVVFKIDLRGHGSSEGEASGAYYSSDYIVDTLNAYSALQNTDLVNPESIGLWGHSMAGNVILRTIAAKPDIPAAVIWAGAVYTYQDLQDYGISDSSYVRPSPGSERNQRRRRLFDQAGEFASDHPFWSQVVPTNYLSDLQTAIQLHHAVDDSTVSIEYSRNLDSVLEDTSVQHQLYEYESGGHDIEGASFNTAMQRTVEFFGEKL